MTKIERKGVANLDTDLPPKEKEKINKKGDAHVQQVLSRTAHLNEEPSHGYDVIVRSTRPIGFAVVVGPGGCPCPAATLIAQLPWKSSVPALRLRIDYNGIPVAVPIWQSLRHAAGRNFIKDSNMIRLFVGLEMRSLDCNLEL